MDSMISLPLSMFLIAVTEDRLSVKMTVLLFLDVLIAVRMAKASTVNMEVKVGRRPLQMIDRSSPMTANDVAFCVFHQ